MENRKDYWRRVKEAGNRLIADGQWAVFLTSIDAPNREDWRAGVVVEAVAELAGKLIVDGTHRLSTPEEIAQFRADQQRREAACAAQTKIFDRRSGRTILSTSEIEGVSNV